MQQRTQPSTRPTRLRGRAIGLLAAGLSVAALAGCGSSGDGTADAKPTDFCTAVEQYVTASKAGDRTDMADRLAASLDGLPDEARRHVAAYVLALRQAPTDHSPDADGVKTSTQEAFDSYVAETCGEDAIPSGKTTTSTTAAATTTTVATATETSGA